MHKETIIELNEELNKIDNAKIINITFIEETDVRMEFEEGFLLLSTRAQITTLSETATFPSKKAFLLISNLIGNIVDCFEYCDEDILVKFNGGCIITIDTSQPTRHEWLMISAGANSFAIA